MCLLISRNVVNKQLCTAFNVVLQLQSRFEGLCSTQLKLSIPGFSILGILVVDLAVQGYMNSQLHD
jgi:hypothetical protein